MAAPPSAVSALRSASAAAADRAVSDRAGSDRAAPDRADSDRAVLDRAGASSRTLAALMPRLVLEARRVAATVIHGLHGRRRAGPGENFWQYRRFVSGESSARVDWRRSARDEHLYVREREWEAAHTVWIWPDRSPSMAFRSALARDSKLDRALVMGLALGEVLVQGGERVGIPGLMTVTANRNVIDRMVQAILHDAAAPASLPPAFAPSPLSEVILLSDLWSPIAEIRTTLARLSAAGAHGHVVQIVDPAEETFPYAGRVEFVEPEGFGSITAGRAEAWRDDYAARIALHRSQIRAETDRIGWSFVTHRTDRPATELMLQLHARLSAGRGAPPPRGDTALDGADAGPLDAGPLDADQRDAEVTDAEVTDARLAAAGDGARRA